MTLPEASATDPRDRPLRVVMVAAYAENRVIGHGGGIPWHLPEDLRHFREVTTGHTLLLGRVTHEGIGRPLPRRTNLVLTRQQGWTSEGVLVVSSIEEALERGRALHAETGADLMVAGGTQVYQAAMPHATHQVLTLVPGHPEGDSHYPDLDAAQWREARRQDHDGFTRVWLERRAPLPAPVVADQP